MFNLPIKNICRRKGQSFITIMITALTIFFFVVILSSFTSIYSGIELTSSRLGADVLILPGKGNTSAYHTLFTAEPQNSYMNKNIIAQLEEFEGISQMTPHFFTQTLDESCCSFGKEIRLVGYDSKTDFILAPWLEEQNISYPDETQIISGSAIPSFLGNKYFILGELFTVVGTLYPTGTGMDNTLFVDINVARRLARNSEYLTEYFINQEPDELVSSIMIKVTPGYDPDKLVESINSSGLDVTTITTNKVISGTRKQILALGKVIWTLWGVIFSISILALFGRFNSLARERRSEIGLLRAMGVQKNLVFILILAEAWLLAAIGGAIGSISGVLAAKPIISSLQTQLSLANSHWTLFGSITTVIVGLLTSLLLCFTASIIPAYKGAMMEPMKAICRGGLD